MTTVFTISGLDLGIDKKINYMKKLCRGFAVAHGRVQVQVSYPAVLDPTGDDLRGSIQTGATNLNRLIRSTPGKKIVLGYSQGAQVAGAWMRRFAHYALAPSADELRFVLVGNPERAYGQPPWVKKSTPNYTQYEVLDVARTDDGWCNWDGSLRRKIGMAGSVHMQYWNTDISVSNPRNTVIKVVGGTTYLVTP